MTGLDYVTFSTNIFSDYTVSEHMTQMTQLRMRNNSANNVNGHKTAKPNN